MYNHLIDFIDSQNILYKFQFGFRKQFSTSHAIISLVEKIRSVLTSGKFMIGVFLDLKKSFRYSKPCNSHLKNYMHMELEVIF